MRKVERKPDFSVVVVYNMAREAPRTLLSLFAGYQRNIEPDNYEVIVVDNGSNPPFDPKVIEGLSGNFRLICIDVASTSPAQADLCHFASHGARLYDRAVVATLRLVSASRPAKQGHANRI